MSSKPILFNTEMVKAILDGRKTQTRRLIKNNKKGGLLENRGYFYRDKFSYNATNNFDDFGKNKIVKLCSKYQTGDTLYVKETWTLGKKFTIKPENVWYIRNDLGNEVYYKADLNDNFYDPDNICKWKPSIHMPKKYARIFLKVTNVRVERLQSISYDDIRNEGCTKDIKTISEDFEFVYELERIHDV